MERISKIKEVANNESDPHKMNEAYKQVFESQDPTVELNLNAGDKLVFVATNINGTSYTLLISMNSKNYSYSFDPIPDKPKWRKFIERFIKDYKFQEKYRIEPTR